MSATGGSEPVAAATRSLSCSKVMLARPVPAPTRCRCSGRFRAAV